MYCYINHSDFRMVYPENMMNPLQMKTLKDPSVKAFKERKKHDRFNGMPEEEVSKRTLPDHLTQNLDIVIVSILFGHCQEV